ncbi:hypothetical protein PAPYR_4658 [Paratrimastix pyriformis]|uniref:Microspherule protein N-terminal domain-containing protein n=1 Tax=Paratrimastix pyriformis TaxID=342808 RepID=A0ABQ8UJG3_9EUKA|nr:hypothetical protein PAPYR_4658 [Paratrimastix pyriformis]
MSESHKRPGGPPAVGKLARARLEVKKVKTGLKGGGRKPPTSSTFQWIQKDDLSLISAVEQGKSFSEIRRTVSFAHPYTIRDLERRWWFLLVGPRTVVECTLSFEELEKAVLTDVLKSEPYTDHSLYLSFEPPATATSPARPSDPWTILSLEAQLASGLPPALSMRCCGPSLGPGGPAAALLDDSQGMLLEGQQPAATAHDSGITNAPTQGLALAAPASGAPVPMEPQAALAAATTTTPSGTTSTITASSATSPQSTLVSGISHTATATATAAATTIATITAATTTTDTTAGAATTTTTSGNGFSLPAAAAPSPILTPPELSPPDLVLLTPPPVPTSGAPAPATEPAVESMAVEAALPPPLPVVPHLDACAAAPPHEDHAAAVPEATPPVAEIPPTQGEAPIPPPPVEAASFVSAAAMPAHGWAAQAGSGLVALPSVLGTLRGARLCAFLIHRTTLLGSGSTCRAATPGATATPPCTNPNPSAAPPPCPAATPVASPISTSPPAAGSFAPAAVSAAPTTPSLVHDHDDHTTAASSAASQAGSTGPFPAPPAPASSTGTSDATAALGADTLTPSSCRHSDLTRSRGAASHIHHDFIGSNHASCRHAILTRSRAGSAPEAVSFEDDEVDVDLCDEDPTAQGTNHRVLLHVSAGGQWSLLNLGGTLVRVGTAILAPGAARALPITAPAFQVGSMHLVVESSPSRLRRLLADDPEAAVADQEWEAWTGCRTP